MSQYQANPRMGHLEMLYAIVHRLKQGHARAVIFDPTTPPVDEKSFAECDASDWTDFYGDMKEEDPRDMPEPLGKPVTITVFVDANHAGNVVTRRSHTGVLTLVQNTVTTAYCKKQNTVESATYGSELVAMRIARDLVVATRIKLKCFGVPLTGPANTYSDNEAVFKNVSRAESQLGKKHNAINYHICREAVAAKIMRHAKEDTETNLADALTKILPIERKEKLLGRFLFKYTKRNATDEHNK